MQFTSSVSEALSSSLSVVCVSTSQRHPVNTQVGGKNPQNKNIDEVNRENKKSEEGVGSVKETGRHEIAIEKSLAAPEKCFDFKETSKITLAMLQNIYR